MVRHVILWKLKDDLSPEAAVKVKSEIQSGLEGLAGHIPGLIDIQVLTNPLPSSNADVMLEVTFVNENALKAYTIHPKHLEVAQTKVRPFTQVRLCFDVEE